MSEDSDEARVELMPGFMRIVRRKKKKDKNPASGEWVVHVRVSGDRQLVRQFESHVKVFSGENGRVDVGIAKESKPGVSRIVIKGAHEAIMDVAQRAKGSVQGVHVEVESPRKEPREPRT